MWRLPGGSLGEKHVSRITCKLELFADSQITALPFVLLFYNIVFLSTVPTTAETMTPSTELYRTTVSTTSTTPQKIPVSTTSGTKGPRLPPAVSTTKIPPVTSFFPLPERFCEPDVARGISWPQTQRGIMVERPCPKGTRGRSLKPNQVK